MTEHSLSKYGITLEPGLPVRSLSDTTRAYPLSGDPTLSDTDADTPISEQEKKIVADAMRLIANARPNDREDAIRALALEWNTLTTPLAKQSGWVSPEWWRATRLVGSYLLAYPEVEEQGSIDSFGGSEAKSVLLALCFDFARNADEKRTFARKALDVEWSAAPVAALT